jgi:hypothetical protein
LFAVVLATATAAITISAGTGESSSIEEITQTGTEEKENIYLQGTSPIKKSGKAKKLVTPRNSPLVSTVPISKTRTPRRTDLKFAHMDVRVNLSKISKQWFLGVCPPSLQKNVVKNTRTPVQRGFVFIQIKCAPTVRRPGIDFPYCICDACQYLSSDFYHRFRILPSTSEDYANGKEVDDFGNKAIFYF